MDKDEALKLALDTFERMNHKDSIFAGEFDKEIIAIKAALAQPVQEPPKYSFKAYWTEDGRISAVACIERPDGGVHLMETIIEPPQEKNT